MDNASSEPTVMPLDLLREITNDFSEERKLGSGSFGKVYLGVNRDGEKIAVKKLYDMLGLDEEHFQNEFKNLTRLRHKNIVRLVGYCHDVQEVQVEYKGKLVIAEKTNRVLCLEYMPNGSLDKYLSDECDKYDWRTGYGIIKGICEGLKYLHKELKPPIYHLDLKPGNVLLDKNMGPRIADFGMSRLFGDEQTQATKSSLGTLGYLPPEYIRRHLISNKFDIFSLGVVIIKIMAGHTGYFNSAEMSSQKFINLVHQNWRNRLHETLSVTEAYSEQIKICIKIGLSCVQEDRHKRPTIQHIVDTLNKTETNCTFASRNGPSLMYQDTFGDITQPGNIYNPNHRQANPSRSDPCSSCNTEANRNTFPQYAQHPNDRYAERIYHGPTFNQDLVTTTHSNCFDENAGRRVTRLDYGWQKDNQEYSGDPLPGIEGFQMGGDPRLGSTSKACGFHRNATTPCTFQVANRNTSLQYAQDLNNRHTEQINHAAFHRYSSATTNYREVLGRKEKTNQPLCNTTPPEKTNAVGGAPLLKLLLPWNRSPPKQAGSRRSSISRDLRLRSPSSSRRSTTASIEGSCARSAIPRNPAKGEASRTGPRSRGLAVGGRSTPKLHGAPPSRERTTTCKNNTDLASSTMAPPADTKLTPTKHLCTDPSIPRPPAAGAAAGGRGIEQIDGEAVARARGSKSRLFYSGNPLPGIEGFQMVGGSRPGVTSRACGFPTNGTTRGNFQWFLYRKDGITQPIRGAMCQVSRPGQGNQKS